MERQEMTFWVHVHKELVGHLPDSRFVKDPYTDKVVKSWMNSFGEKLGPILEKCSAKSPRGYELACIRIAKIRLLG